MAAGAVMALIGPVANLLGKGLSFIPNGENRNRLNQKSEIQLRKESEIAELEKEEQRAKQTTVIVYSVLGLIILAVIVVVIIKKRKK